MARHFVQATNVLIMYMIISALLAMDTEPFVALYIYRHVNFITCKSKYESKNNGVTIPLTYMVCFKIVYPKSFVNTHIRRDLQDCMSRRVLREIY